MAVVPADDGALVMRFDSRRFPHPAIQTKRYTGVTCTVAVRTSGSRYFENVIASLKFRYPLHVDSVCIYPLEEPIEAVDMGADAALSIRNRRAHRDSERPIA